MSTPIDSKIIDHARSSLELAIASISTVWNATAETVVVAVIATSERSRTVPGIGMDDRRDYLVDRLAELRKVLHCGHWRASQRIATPEGQASRSPDELYNLMPWNVYPHTRVPSPIPATLLTRSHTIPGHANETRIGNTRSSVERLAELCIEIGWGAEKYQGSTPAERLSGPENWGRSALMLDESRHADMRLAIDQEAEQSRERLEAMIRQMASANASPKNKDNGSQPVDGPAGACSFRVGGVSIELNRSPNRYRLLSELWCNVSKRWHTGRPVSDVMTAIWPDDYDSDDKLKNLNAQLNKQLLRAGCLAKIRTGGEGKIWLEIK
jgi:hypothetical protein